MSSIFVQIPSYCDFELPKTILSATQNASQQNQINFGICNITLDKNYIYIPQQNLHWSRISLFDDIAPKNIGLQKARKIANNFYDGEDYYLQIDAHMRFEKDWDIRLIELIVMYKNIGFKKPLLTTYPPSYWYNSFLVEEFGSLKNVNAISFLENKNKFETTYVPSQLAIDINPNCFYTASVSGGFIFTIGEYANIIPNEKIAFWGEEILIAARAYTHGFDLLLPDQSYMWHLYYDHNKTIQENGRRHVWKDFPKEWNILEQESKQELSRIFSNAVVGPNELGSERSLQEYGQYAGLDFLNKKVTQCKWG